MMTKERLAELVNNGYDDEIKWMARRALATLELEDWLKSERVPAGTVNMNHADTIADNTIDRVQTELFALVKAK